MSQNGAAHLFISINFQRIITILEVIDLSVTFQNNLYYLFSTSGQNISQLRVNPSLGVGFINERLRNLNNGSPTEDIDITSVMNSINILGMINTISNISNTIYDGISTHSTNELRRSKNYNTVAISTNSIDQLHHLIGLKGVRNYLISIRTSRSIYGSAKSLMNLIEYSVSQTIGQNLHNLSHSLSTIQHTLEVNGGASADSVASQLKGVTIQTEGLIHTRQANLSQELLGTHLTDTTLEDSLLALRNRLNLSEHTDSINYLLRHNLIGSLNYDIINIIAILHELVYGTSQFLQTIQKSRIHIYILISIGGGNSTLSAMKGNFLQFFNSHYNLPSFYQSASTCSLIPF